MASRPSPGVAYILFQYFAQDDQKEYTNLFWYSVTSGSFDPAIDGPPAVTAFLSGPLSAITDKTGFPISYRGVRATLSNGALVVSTDVYVPLSGGQDGTVLPNDVCVVVQKITEQAGPDARGRWYFPGIPISYTTGSYLTSEGQIAWTTVAVALKQPMTFTSSIGPVVLSPAHFSRKAANLYAIKNDPVIGLLGTKRSRRGPF